MTVLITLSILMAPFAVAVVLGWAAHRSAGLRVGVGQFLVSAPMRGRLSGDSSDAPRMQHELDAIRTRFEQQPSWPTSGALGERR
ncbi:MAG TPA: hypothetical protein VLU24_04935 [Mycobacterium sp.]|jgi:hypothetical protein|nr:hypothetical protein [Mycobacterium sp.]